MIILPSAIGLLGLVPAVLSAAPVPAAASAECADEASPAPSESASRLSSVPEPSPTPSEQNRAVSYRFRITTDANGDIGRITEILASPNAQRNLINNEVAENDAKGCYPRRPKIRRSLHAQGGVGGCHGQVLKHRPVQGGS